MGNHIEQRFFRLVRKYVVRDGGRVDDIVVVVNDCHFIRPFIGIVRAGAIPEPIKDGYAISVLEKHLSLCCQGADIQPRHKDKCHECVSFLM